MEAFRGDVATLRCLRDANAAALAVVDGRLAQLRVELTALDAAAGAPTAHAAVVHKTPSAAVELKFRDPFSAPNRSACGQRLRPQPGVAALVEAACQQVFTHPLGRGWTRSEDDALAARMAEEAENAAVARNGNGRLPTLDWESIAAEVRDQCAGKAAHVWATSPAVLVGKPAVAARQRVLLSTAEVGCSVTTATAEAREAVARARALPLTARASEFHAVWEAASAATGTAPFELLRLAIKAELSEPVHPQNGKKNRGPARAPRWTPAETQSLEIAAATAGTPEVAAIAMNLEATADASRPLRRFALARTGRECSKRARQCGIAFAGAPGEDGDDDWALSSAGSRASSDDGSDGDGLSDVPYAVRLARGQLNGGHGDVANAETFSTADSNTPYVAIAGRSRLPVTQLRIEAAIAATVGSMAAAARLLAPFGVGRTDLANFVRGVRRERSRRKSVAAAANANGGAAQDADPGA